MEEVPKEMPKAEGLKIGTLVAIIIIVLCVGAASAYVGYRYGVQSGKTESEAQYQEAISVFMPPMPSEITSFSGEVEKIENKTLYVRGSKPTTEFLELGQEITMKVSTTDATKFFKLAMIAPEEMVPPEEGVPPEPFKRTEMKFGDIKEGAYITATATENIMGQEEFEATEIQITEMEMLPAPIPEEVPTE